MATYFTDDFADFPADWTERIKTPGTWAVASGDLSIPAAALNDWNVLSWDDLDADGNRANVEVLGIVTMSSFGRWFTSLRTSGADESTTNYSIYFSSTLLRVYYCAGADTPATLASATQAHSAGTDYWFRFRLNGASPTTVQAKAWTGAIGDEPGTWDIDTTDSTGPQVAGWVGPSMYSSNATTSIKQFGVGTNGDTAPAAAGGASLNLAASSLSIAGTVGATGDLQYGAGLNLSASALAVAGAVAVSGDLAYLVPTLDLSVSALALSGALAPSGDILAGTSFDLAASSLSLTGAASLAGDIQITTAVVLDLAASPLSISGAVLAAGDVAFGTSFDLAAGALSLAGAVSLAGDIQITTAVVLDLAASLLSISGAVLASGDLAASTAALLPPAGRTLRIAAESRALLIAAEQRSVSVAHETRTLRIPS